MYVKSYRTLTIYSTNILIHEVLTVSCWYLANTSLRHTTCKIKHTLIRLVFLNINFRTYLMTTFNHNAYSSG